MKNSIIYTAFFISGFLFAIPHLQVDGFTRLGSDAPAIKMKKFTGVTSDSENDFVSILHGLDASKILGILVNVNHVASFRVQDQYDNAFNLGLEFSVGWNSSNIFIENHATNSENILSKPFSALVFYDE